jgi:hypothetical protein
VLEGVVVTYMGAWFLFEVNIGDKSVELKEFTLPIFGLIK